MEFAAPFTVLDGGLSTALEAAGHDLGHELWTARLLLEQPAAIIEAHLAYLRAGAEVLITSSYQASVAGITAGGSSRADALSLLGLTTELARIAVARFRMESPKAGSALVAASVGPYGAVLADGSEYRGDYSLDHAALVAFHHERLEVLVASEPDLLACETIPSAAEAAAVRDSLTALPPVPTWITFTCGDETTTWAGDPIEEAIELACSVPQVVAVGVNCTAPDLVGPLLERCASVTALPLVAYANSGQRWDARRDGWIGPAGGIPTGDQLERWVADGARLIGGCCGIGPEGIRALRTWRDTAWFPDPDTDAA